MKKLDVLIESLMFSTKIHMYNLFNLYAYCKNQLPPQLCFEGLTEAKRYTFSKQFHLSLLSSRQTRPSAPDVLPLPWQTSSVC